MRRTTMNPDETRARLEAIVAAAVRESENGWRVLDAGCGTVPPHLMRVPGVTEYVGLDVSPEAMARNPYLDRAIVADVESYPLAESFDLVICWDVLEHLSRPAAAIRNLAHGVRPGGLLVLGVPNIWSLKALVTKLTPHWFHVWVYRRLHGLKEAGKPGYGPYPVFMRRDIAPARLEALAREAGLAPVFATSYGTLDASRLPRGLEATWRLAVHALRALTFGRWDPAVSEHVVVLRRTL